jgi:hypothetical protein
MLVVSRLRSLWPGGSRRPVSGFDRQPPSPVDGLGAGPAIRADEARFDAIPTGAPGAEAEAFTDALRLYQHALHDLVSNVPGARQRAWSLACNIGTMERHQIAAMTPSAYAGGTGDRSIAPNTWSAVGSSDVTALRKPR